jgi:cyclopropane fatty-acyl-phospholipid synthase-like methyltransferase
MNPPMNSNVEFWKELQDEDYFENHPCYKGVMIAGGEESILAIEHFFPLTPEMKLVVIGCGYGRETFKLAQRVSRVYGIDVSERILQKAERFLTSNGISNFTPVLCDGYASAVPDGIDVVFSIVVMQHLTRDLVRDYFRTLGKKLAPGGHFVVQFLEELYDGVDERDAELKKYEPSISWTGRQIVELIAQAGLEVEEIRTIKVTPTALWHWACARRGG